MPDSLTALITGGTSGIGRATANKLAQLELSGTVKALQRRRKELQKELDVVSEAISSLQKLSPTPSRNGHGRRVMSMAARKRIAKAQRERWAKVPKEKG